MIVNPERELQDAILAAWRFAAQAHLGQTLPDGDLPYVVHVGSVAMEVMAAHALEPLAAPDPLQVLHSAREGIWISVSVPKTACSRSMSSS